MRRTASSTTPRPCGRRRTSGGWVVACSLARRAAVVSAVVQAAADVVVAAHAHDHGSSRSSVGGGDSAQLPSFLFILGDDIGWADMGYSGGTARTPHIDEWAESEGSIKMMDFHSGGTVCSPTRASLLTGRTPYRDCVFGVYPCSDMTECLLRPIDWLSVFLSLFLSLPPSLHPPLPPSHFLFHSLCGSFVSSDTIACLVLFTRYTPDFVFAPQRTFTIADAARLASPDYQSRHFGKVLAPAQRQYTCQCACKTDSSQALSSLIDHCRRGIAVAFG